MILENMGFAKSHPYLQLIVKLLSCTSVSTNSVRITLMKLQEHLAPSGYLKIPTVSKVFHLLSFRW